jgi:hypothetical protein
VKMGQFADHLKDPWAEQAFGKFRQPQPFGPIFYANTEATRSLWRVAEARAVRMHRTASIDAFARLKVASVRGNVGDVGPTMWFAEHIVPPEIDYFSSMRVYTALDCHSSRLRSSPPAAAPPPPPSSPPIASPPLRSLYPLSAGVLRGVGARSHAAGHRTPRLETAPLPARAAPLCDQEDWNGKGPREPRAPLPARPPPGPPSHAPASRPISTHAHRPSPPPARPHQRGRRRLPRGVGGRRGSHMTRLSLLFSSSPLLSFFSSLFSAHARLFSTGAARVPKRLKVSRDTHAAPQDNVAQMQRPQRCGRPAPMQWWRSCRLRRTAHGAPVGATRAAAAAAGTAVLESRAV